MKRVLLSTVWLLPWLAVPAANRPAQACPFCSAMTETLSEQIANMDAAVITRLAELPPWDEQQPLPPASKLEFRIVEVLKGQPLLEGRPTVTSVYFGDPRGKQEQSFLLLGTDPPQLGWTAPLAVSSRACEYVRRLAELPAEGPQRLARFLPYLEDADELLAKDAYEEFARAPYDTLKALQPQMDHPRLVRWIQDPGVAVNHRRLYLTMLGVCGSRGDLPMLEKLLNADDRGPNTGLDAMIGCYLTLAGPDGLPLIEELFLKHDQVEYADTYSAIMALRFHGSEGDVIPRPRIVAALRYVLERPELADLVIPDLARWEDWTVMPRLVQLFKEAEDGASWVRVPVVKYLLACPRPEAQEYLRELEKIDPEAVKRANTFLPFGGGGPPRSPSRS